MISRHAFLILLLSTAMPTPVLAQEAQEPGEGASASTVAQDGEATPPVLTDEEMDAASEEGAIVITGQRERGAVLGDVEPEIQLDRRDIRAYGAGSISELLDALAPQTQSGRGRGEGRPITLVNGRRISSFREIRDLPPEAIERIDILPEEVALTYGYRADQRVVNFVLRPRFRAVTAEVEGGFPTAGGRATGEFDLNLLRLNRNGRWSLDAEYERSTMLLESERDIIGNELGQYRSLLPQSDQLELGGTINRTILGDVSATADARYEESGSESRLGLASSEDEILFRDAKSRTGHLGVAANGDILPWRWSFTGNYDRTQSTTLTDREYDLGAVTIERDQARTRTETVSGELVVNGSIADLPAGDVSTSFRLGAERLGLASESVRGGIEQDRELSRGSGNFQANLDVPIASRRRDVLSAIGDLSVNANAEVERLSDFGTLRTLGGGLRWSPIEEVDVIASITDEDGAPSVGQLGDPTVATPNVRVFDFVRNETVDITRIEGGNPNLLADNRRVMKLGVTVKPLEEDDLSITANYISSRTRNLISSFPTATPEIEAAFPDRFVRDSSGRLVSIDSRPLNFTRADRQEFRWGVNFSKPIESAPPPRAQRRRERQAAGGEGASQQGQQAQGGAEAQAAPRGGGRGFGRFGGRGGRGQGGRLQLALYHTWNLENKILIREGVPVLDLLDGSATGSRGGQPKHEIDFQAGLFKNGFGARLNADWKSGTFVDGGPDGFGGERSDLRFSPFFTINARLFADLGQQRSLIEKFPFLRRTRVSLSIDNVFDARLKVRDETGATPVSYQPDLIDPLGRSIRISIRKQFF